MGGENECLRGRRACEAERTACTCERERVSERTCVREKEGEVEEAAAYSMVMRMHLSKSGYWEQL